MSKIPEIPFDRVLGGIGEGYAYACHERGGSKEDHYFISESEAREILADRERLKELESKLKITADALDEYIRHYGEGWAYEYFKHVRGME